MGRPGCPAGPFSGQDNDLRQKLLMSDLTLRPGNPGLIREKGMTRLLHPHLTPLKGRKI